MQRNSRNKMWNKIVEKIEEIMKGNKIYFCDIAEEWLTYKKNSVKQSTYYKYAYNIQKYLNEEIGKIELNKLEKYNFNSMIQNISPELSAKTVKEIANILKSILKYAEQKYDINVKIDLISSPKVQIEDVEILSKREKEKLQKYCLKEASLRSYGILVCLYAGFRIGEICALRWEDIDLEKRVIHVQRTLQRLYKEDKTTQVVIDTPKTRNSVRSVPISNKLYKILKPLKGKHKKEDFFLTGKSDKYIEPRNYQYYFKICLKNCKVKHYKFHVLRHTFATNCIEVGMDVKSLSEILGHASVDVTLNRYVHSSYGRKKKFLEKL